MREVLGGVQRQEPTRAASLPSWVGRRPIGLPPPVGVVLKSARSGRFTHVGFMKKEESISLSPRPVLDLGPEIGDVGKDDGEGVMAMPCLLDRRFDVGRLSVLHELVQRFFDEPDL